MEENEIKIGGIDIYNIPITIDNDFENLIEKEINQIALSK